MTIYLVVDQVIHLWWCLYAYALCQFNESNGKWHDYFTTQALQMQFIMIAFELK